MKNKLNAGKKGIAFAKEKMLAFSILLTLSTSSLANQGGGGSFNPVVLIQNLGDLLYSIQDLLGVIFGFLGFLLTGFGLYTAIQILRGAQSVQRMENPWAYVAGSLIIGPILMSVAFVMTGMWDAITVSGATSEGVVW